MVWMNDDLSNETILKNSPLFPLLAGFSINSPELAVVWVILKYELHFILSHRKNSFLLIL